MLSLSGIYLATIIIKRLVLTELLYQHQYCATSDSGQGLTRLDSNTKHTHTGHSGKEAQPHRNLPGFGILGWGGLFQREGYENHSK